MEQSDEAMETPLGDRYTILTGGAEGTDTIAEQWGRELGMYVALYIPQGHARSKTITPLTWNVLSQADLLLSRAAKVLGKAVNYTESNYKTNLLRRNYWIVKGCDVLYAFGQFEDPHNPCTLKGGTGWTVQLALEMKKSPELFFTSPTILVYDMYHKAWFQLVKPTEQAKQTVISPFVFTRLYTKPLLKKISALVGSRFIDESTSQEIKSLFDRTAQEVLQYRQQL